MPNTQEVKNLNILICESDHRVLKRLKSWVKAMGITVVTSSDGLDAIKLYKNKIPDILIVSQKLNSIGVIEFLEKIKEIEPDQTIIMMLNEALDSFIFKRSIDLNVDKYINKPIDATSLFNAVEFLSKIIDTKEKVKTQAIDAKIQKLVHLKEVNKVKDSFLTVFTHELRTPLNTIINFSEYVHKHLLKQNFNSKDKLASQIKEINSSGYLMLDMINNLIDAIKLRDNRLDISFAEISLNIAIEEIVSKYEKQYKNLKFIKDYDEDYMISADNDRIKQILNNLISNAVKYSKTNIRISLKHYNNNFKIVVSDDGDGFKNKKHIISLFEQSGEDDMTRTAQGAGVGLYIVRGLCEKMGFEFKIDDSARLGGAKVVISGKKGL